MQATQKFRALAVLGLTATLLAGGIVASQSASAVIGGGGCRLKGYAPEPGGILLNPCSEGWALEGVDVITGYTYVQNPNGIPIDVCMQVYRVNADNSTTYAANLGCNGWSRDTTAGWRANPQDPMVWDGPSQGTFVIQAGYWATIDGVYAYYGGAQSARIQEY